jgi:hypothetical protein
MANYGPIGTMRQLEASAVQWWTDVRSKRNRNGIIRR